MTDQIRLLKRRNLLLGVTSITFGVLLVTALVLIPSFSASRKAVMKYEGYVVPIRPIPSALCDDGGLVHKSVLELEMRHALQSSVGTLDDVKSTSLETWSNVTKSGTPFEEFGANLLTSYAPFPDAYIDSLPSMVHISRNSQFALSFKYRVREYLDEEKPEQRLFLMLELRRLARDGGFTIVRDTAVLAELADRIIAHLRKENEP